MSAKKKPKLSEDFLARESKVSREVKRQQSEHAVENAPSQNGKRMLTGVPIVGKVGETLLHALLKPFSFKDPCSGSQFVVLVEIDEVGSIGVLQKVRDERSVALPMLALSRSYEFAVTPTQLGAYAAAGGALLARGAHGTPGVLWGSLLSEVSALAFCVVMLHGRVFGATISVLGLVGFALLIVYNVLTTFVPQTRKFAIALAVPGGMVTLAWQTVIALRLIRDGRPS